MLARLNEFAQRHYRRPVDYVTGLEKKVASQGDHPPTARYLQYQLHSVFQPIFSLPHKRAVGCEALMRVKDQQQQPVPITTVFDRLQDDQQLIQLDRLCHLLHAHSYQRTGDDLNWLLLNTSPQVIARHGDFSNFFAEMLERFLLPAERVVIELIETPATDIGQLVEAFQFYKALGCLTAIDDFGAGHSNFERVWMLEPDLVKLDRSMLVRANNSSKVRQMLGGIVELLHQAGSLVLMEGVETEDQALIAIDAGTDLVQGYYFAKPDPTWPIPDAALPGFNRLFEHHKQSQLDQQQEHQALVRRYSEQILPVVSALQLGGSLQSACPHLLEDPDVSVCYLLQEDGTQLGENLCSKHLAPASRARFRPLQSAHNADWFGKQYLQRSLQQPGQIHLTRPYLSTATGYRCITLSIMFRIGSAKRIFCCDLHWD